MKQFRSVLESPVPHELSQFYQEILDRLEHRRLGPFVKELLTWTIGSERALRIEELQAAMEMALEEEYIDFNELLKANLRSLVEVVTSPIGSIVQINHTSLHDFITDLLLSKSYFIDPSFIQSHIAEICMRQLSKSTELRSFTQYTAFNWMEHINRAQEESIVSSHLLECFYKFFHGDGLTHWLMEEILKDSSGRFYDYDIHIVVIGLRAWMTKVIKSASYESSGDLDAIQTFSTDASDPMSSAGSSSTAIPEPDVIQWMTRITKSGTQILHEFIGSTLARLWIRSKFEDYEEIVAAFKIAWKFLYLSAQSHGDEDDEIWKVSKKSGKCLLWTEPSSSGEIIDVSYEFGYDESRAICSLNVAVILVHYKFDSDAINYLETATFLQPSLSSSYAILGARACKDQRVEDAILYFEFSDSNSVISNAFCHVGNSPATGATPMHYAAWWGCADAIRLLSDAGKEISVRDSYGQLPVHYAAAGGHIETIRALEEKGADISVRVCDMNKFTTLHFAAQFGKLEAVQWLIGKQQDVNARSSREGMTALHLAAQYGSLDVIKWLVRNGGNTEVRDFHSETVLHRATRSRNMKVFEWLVDNGARVKSLTNKGRTVLHSAA